MLKKKELENCNNLKKQNDDLKKELDRITNIKQQNEEIKKELEIKKGKARQR